MSKNILVHLGGINCTAYLRKATKTTTYGDSISKYEFEFTKNVEDAVTITNALTVRVWCDDSSPPATKVFEGFIDLFAPQAGLIKIIAKDQLATLINKQIMHYYESDIPGDAAYPDGKISNIFADIVVTYGGLTATSSGLTPTIQDSGTAIVLEKFYCKNSDPFERCRKLAETLNWVFYYKASNGYVYFEPKNYTTYTTTLSVGVNIVMIPTWEYDRSELINDLRLEGAQQLVQANQLFSGDASTTEFTLSNIPEDLAVYYSAAKNYSTTAKLASEIKTGNIENSIETHDYEVDKKNKTVTFTSFVPASGTNNIIVELSYYAPIPIHLMNDASIATYGTYAKTIGLLDVFSLDDAWSRAENILSKYSEPFKSAKLKVLSTALENYVVTGSLVPNATGIYRHSGTYSGYNYYTREDGAWFLWYNLGSAQWFISREVGSGGQYLWLGEDLSGSYAPSAESAGTATVAIYPLQVGQSIRIVDSINVPNVDQ